MKRAISLTFAVLLLSASGLMWFAGGDFTDWLSSQRFIVEEEREPLLGLQEQEHWLVVVVDFPDHPVSDAWGPEEAERLLDQAAIPYIDQLSASSSNLTIEVHPTVVRAASNLAAYGADGSGKDTDINGEFLPASLAQEVVEHLRTSLDWVKGDLNDDGLVDRLLLLHSTKGQEESSGVQERIWSHFTSFEEPLEVEDGLLVSHYTMASLQTGSSGVGTILHEMLHQMGAVDLYPVHDEGSFQAWKGPGDWDIMASGNWNGGGRWPALPTGATLDLIGAQRIRPVDLEWPLTASEPCIGPHVELSGLSEGGDVLKIQIAEDEYVYVEHRTASGYDERLPGSGVLVTYQDLSVGDIESNELNTNANLPWLMVVEADEGNELVSGANQGEASDLFLNNSSFGAEGVEIRTHDGLLVPWTARVTTNTQSAHLSFVANNCSPTFDLDLPDHGATVLAGDAIAVELSNAADCNSELIASDGRTVALEFNANEASLSFSTPGTPNSIVQVQGRLTCDGTSVDLDYKVQILNRIPMLDAFSGTVHPTENGVLTVPLASSGEGAQPLSVKVSGPLERVTTSPASVDLATGELVLTVEPNGLLMENMLIKGEVVLSTSEGAAWVLPVELVAQSSERSWGGTFFEIHEILALLLSLMGLSFLGALRPPKQTVPSPEKAQTPLSQPPHGMDPWGRPMDAQSSSISQNVEVEDGP